MVAAVLFSRMGGPTVAPRPADDEVAWLDAVQPPEEPAAPSAKTAAAEPDADNALTFGMGTGTGPRP